MFIQRIAGADIKRSSIPKVADIINAKKAKIGDDLNSILEEGLDKKYYNWAKNLLEENNPTELVAALLNYSFEDDLNADSYGSVKEIGKKSKPLDNQGKARLFITLGKKDKMTARKLVDLIVGKVSIKSRLIDDVQVMESFSFITVPFEYAEKIIHSFTKKGKRPLVSHAKKGRD